MRFNLAERLARFYGVLLPHIRAAESGDSGHGELYAGIHYHFTRSDYFVPSFAFVDFGENRVAARFYAHVYHLQPELMQRLQLGGSFGKYAFGRCVARYALAFWYDALNMFENLNPI